ncbi:hypothetical protein [Tenacibaculum phage JQ]|nr:hypothetical protein [Tenacibaculum phage JQ]
MKIKFYANGIKAVKTNLTEKQKANIELTAEKFRQNMLAKHGLLFKKAPHTISIEY